jgi:hypothetical protein
LACIRAEIIDRFDFTLKYLIARLDTLPTVALHSTQIVLANLGLAYGVGAEEESRRILFNSLLDHPIGEGQEKTRTLGQLALVARDAYLRRLHVVYAKAGGTHREHGVIRVVH